MSLSITIDLPAEVRAALEAATRTEGVTESEIVERALKSYFFARRFRELRDETLAQLREAGRGDLTDDDVFRLVS